ncbi:hypothetical protein Q9Q94_12050 [Uliginosibacterium sp. 31-16]|uniref:hypothetical protein n=1 Tax=Uliginosibacterium sp. 31-16 TaxID=3068315 RepID=UPI00273E5374|nr:hypothetical protein [Uliginosibacterium sp. 31-16]MDP5240265.1 hypothetical protein [Uliginosibacterium sp. 31-16]
MKKFYGVAASFLCLAVLAACSSAPSIPASSAPVVIKGDALVTNSGDITYLYKKDAANKSACVRDCLKVFSPLFAAPEDRTGGDYQIIEREDGMSQWTYKGKPLYTCPVPALTKDAKPAQVKAAAKKKEDCAKGLASDWIAAKP